MTPDDQDRKLLWRLAIFRVSNKSLVGGLTAFATSMAGSSWSSLTGTQMVLVIIGCVVVMGNTVDAFLDRTASRLSQGKPPNGTGDTETFKKP